MIRVVNIPASWYYEKPQEITVDIPPDRFVGSLWVAGKRIDYWEHKPCGFQSKKDS